MIFNLVVVFCLLCSLANLMNVRFCNFDVTSECWYFFDMLAAIFCLLAVYYTMAPFSLRTPNLKKTK